MTFFKATPKPETPKIEVKEKIKYSDIKKCILKKEAGEHTDECKKIFEKAGVED